MTDAELQALAVGEVVYLMDQDKYIQATVTTAPTPPNNQTPLWWVALDRNGTRVYFPLDRVIGRDLADVDAHRIMQIHKSEIVTSDPEQFADDIAAAVRAAEQRGYARGHQDAVTGMSQIQIDDEVGEPDDGYPDD